MKQTQTNMASGHPLALLLKMSVPIMISMTVQSLYNIVDSIFVARLGNEALSAVSLVYPLQNIILAIGVGFGVGVCSIVSMDLGSQNAENANRAASTGMFLSFVHTLIYTLVGLLIAGPFLEMFTNNPNTYAMGLSYANIVIACSFAQILQITFEKIFQALGRMVEVMLLLGVGAVINVVLNFFFIPIFGVNGAAFATFLSYLVVFLLRVIDTRRFMPMHFYPVRLLFNTVVLLAQAFIMVLEIRGWIFFEIVLTALMVIANMSAIWATVCQVLFRQKKTS